MRCPQCKNRLIRKSENGDTQVRITGRIILKSDTCEAQCYFCKTAVSVPLRLYEPRTLIVKADSRKLIVDK